jgi:hypothetical protein
MNDTFGRVSAGQLGTSDFARGALMPRLLKVASALLVSTVCGAPAFAQTPATAGGQAAPRRQAAAQAAPAVDPRTGAIPVPVAKTQATRRRSIVHHYPYPYPGYYQDDRRAGWRNPGGVGRYAEYYPPGDQFQLNMIPPQPLYAAGFTRGGGIPTRADQLAAQQIGIQRENAIQSHIDNYARPYFGYGLGVGFFGGFN